MTATNIKATFYGWLLLYTQTMITKVDKLIDHICRER